MTFEPGIITRIITVTPIVCLVSTIAIANFELLRKLPHFRRFLCRFIALKVGVVAKNFARYARIPFISTSFTQSCPTLQSLPTALSDERLVGPLLVFGASSDTEVICSPFMICTYMYCYTCTSAYHIATSLIVIETAFLLFVLYVDVASHA